VTDARMKQRRRRQADVTKDLAAQVFEVLAYPLAVLLAAGGKPA